MGSQRVRHNWVTNANILDQTLICLCDFPPACPLGERCDLWRAPGETDPLHFLPLISTKHEDAVCTSQAGRQNPGAVVLNSDGELGVEKMGACLACFRCCWSLLGPHVFLGCPSWTQQKCELWLGKVRTDQPPNFSVLCSNWSYPLLLKWPPSFCRAAPRNGKHTPSWMSCSFYFVSNLIVVMLFSC